MIRIKALENDVVLVLDMIKLEGLEEAYIFIILRRSYTRGLNSTAHDGTRVYGAGNDVRVRTPCRRSSRW